MTLRATIVPLEGEEVGKDFLIVDVETTTIDSLLDQAEDWDSGLLAIYTEETAVIFDCLQYLKEDILAAISMKDDGVNEGVNNNDG